MSSRISKAQLDALCEYPNKITGGDFEIGYAYDQTSLERKRGSVDVSPRFSKPDLYQWMHVFIDGFEFANH